MENGCDHLYSDFDCQNGWSAECLGNLSALAIEIAVIHKLGKVGPLGDAGKALDACSFSPETLVVMGNGSVKPIKDVRLGDKVESTDPRDGITTDKVVTALHHNHDTDLADLTVVDDSGARAIVHTTQNHPFWDVTSHKWTEAGKLRPGDQLRSSTTNHIHVVAVLPLIKPRTMLNLTVADIHTYYVMAGDTPVLVHNKCGDTTTMGSRGKPFRGGAPNVATEISGRTYTGHALDRMQQQGIVPSVVEDAINGPAIPGKRPGTTAYYSDANDLTVVVDTQSGRVVTVDYGRIRQ
jgi:hypothetical protein